MGIVWLFNARSTHLHLTLHHNKQKTWLRRTLVSRRNSMSPTSWPRSLAPRREKNLASSVHQASLGLPQGEGPPGSPEQAVVHPQRHHVSHLRDREDQVFQHVQVPEG